MCQIWDTDERKAFYISLLFLVFPFHYYFSMFYSEALFFTLLIFSFILIYQRKYSWLPLLLIPLTLTRPNGLIVLLPLYLYYLEGEGLLSKKHFTFKRLFSWKNTGITCLFATGVLSFTAYCIYQYRLTGYYNAFTIAQAGWGKSFTLPWQALFSGSEFYVQFNSVYTILTVIYAIYICHKIPLSWNILIWISLIFPLLGGNTMSMPRFISVIFPIMLVLGTQLFALQKIKINYILLFCFFGLQLWCFTYWLMRLPFSY
jgi:hypothetical protein